MNKSIYTSLHFFEISQILRYLVVREKTRVRRWDAFKAWKWFKITQYIFPYSSFHVKHDGDYYFYVQQFSRKFENFLQPNVSLFIPTPILYYRNIFRFTK